MAKFPLRFLPSIFSISLKNPTSPFSHLTHHSISSTSNNPNPQTPTNYNFTPPPRTRTRTPLEKQFETWVDKLKPGFTPDDVDQALKSQHDTDLALDIFRWTSQQRNYKHNHITYHTIIHMSIRSKRFGHAEALIEEVIAGACCGSEQLYNLIIKHCCRQKKLFNRAFDVYKKMIKSRDCKPNLETYTMLLNAVLSKFSKVPICYVYMHGVRSLHKQMKVSGVIPDTFVLNLIIKAYSKCLDLDGAIRVFCEMGLYGCEPNEYSYSYIAKGLCEKGKVDDGMRYYKEMMEKGFVGTSSTYMILVCSLSMEWRFEDAIKIMFDMLDCSKIPDLLTYKTVLEELCRAGRGDDAFELLEELRRRTGAMGDSTYNTLLDRLHFMKGE